MKMRETNHSQLWGLGLILFFTLISSAKAGTIMVGIGAFNNSQIVIDFGSVAQDTVLSIVIYSI